MRGHRYIAFAAIEMKFRRESFSLLKLSEGAPDGQRKADWPALRSEMTAVIKRKTRHQWAAIFEGSEACVSPVLTMTEALHHPHAVAPQAFQTVEGVQQPRPVPRFSRTPAAPAEPPQATDANVEHALRAWGYSAGQVASLMQSKTVGLTGRRAHA